MPPRSFDLKDLQWVYGEARFTGPKVGDVGCVRIGPLSRAGGRPLTFFDLLFRESHNRILRGAGGAGLPEPVAAPSAEATAWPYTV